MRDILSGLSDDDSDEEGSVDSYLEEMRRKQANKDAKGRVKFSGDNTKRSTLEVIESGSSLCEVDDDL
jgi:hypothetical protein